MIRDAYFAGGCFWCITPVFEEMHGVLSVRCGYSGGSKEDAVYEKVKSQQTLHRETLRVTYDAEKVSYGELLDVFLSSVDPFDGGGQFIDRGRSYTLAVFFGDESEKNEATVKLKKLEAESGRKIFVSVEGFFRMRSSPCSPWVLGSLWRPTNRSAPHKIRNSSYQKSRSIRKRA